MMTSFHVSIYFNRQSVKGDDNKKGGKNLTIYKHQYSHPHAEKSLIFSSNVITQSIFFFKVTPFSYELKLKLRCYSDATNRADHSSPQTAANLKLTANHYPKMTLPSILQIYSISSHKYQISCHYSVYILCC